MPHFLFGYHGGKTPDAKRRNGDRGGEAGSTIGAAIVDPGNPVGMSKTVSIGLSVMRCRPLSDIPSSIPKASIRPSSWQNLPDHR